MRKDREEQFDPSQPALIVTYGNTGRKHRPLDGDLIVIGRSPCCDVGLVSPEVAPIHCVIVKTADGWRIRDCTGRSGTRLNGQSIHDEALNDGDALQIGTFSFQLNLPRGASTDRREPPTSAAPPPALTVSPSQTADNKIDEAKVLHLKQSRERLARHALNLRRRLREKKAEAPISPSHLDPEHTPSRADLEQREKKLRFWEKELTEHDRSLRQEYAEVEHQRKELQRFAQESLTRKQAELEQKVEATLAARRAELEAQAKESLAAQRAELDQFADSLQRRENKLELERRQLEEETPKILAAREADLAALEETLQRKQLDLEAQLKQLAACNAELDAGRAALQREFEDIERSRQELETDLAAQMREAEEHLETLWRRCDEHRQRIEEQHGPIVALPDVAALTHDLDIRARELDAYARHLQRTHLTLIQYEQELSEAYQQFHAEYDNAGREAQAIKDQAFAEANAIRRQAKPSESHSDETLAWRRMTDTDAAEATLNQLRQEAERIRADLTRQLAEERTRADKADAQVKSLKMDLVNLRNDVRQRAETVERLKAELKQHEEIRRPVSVNGEIMLAAPDQLLTLVEQLQQNLAERDLRIDELNRRLDKLQRLSDAAEQVAYEEELERYRLELEQDRVLLNDEIARLQVFQAEVEEARQETELNISRERLQIAREWTEINRVREQLHREHLQPEQADSTVRERPSKAKQPKIEGVEATPSSPSVLPPSDLIARLGRGSRSGLIAPPSQQNRDR